MDGQAEVNEKLTTSANAGGSRMDTVSQDHDFQGASRMFARALFNRRSCQGRVSCAIRATEGVLDGRVTAYA
jgi:hypothetical protein